MPLRKMTRGRKRSQFSHHCFLPATESREDNKISMGPGRWEQKNSASLHNSYSSFSVYKLHVFHSTPNIWNKHTKIVTQLASYIYHEAFEDITLRVSHCWQCSSISGFNSCDSDETELNHSEPKWLETISQKPYKPSNYKKAFEIPLAIPAKCLPSYNNSAPQMMSCY